MEILSLLLVYLLLSISVSYMWSNADVFLWARKILVDIPYIRRTLLCPECASFWFGLGVAFLFNPLATIPIYGGYIIQCIFSALITHLFASLLYRKGVLI